MNDRITVNPKQCGGKPCVRGMRIRVIDVLELLEAGMTQDEIIRQLPDPEIDDVAACVEYSKTSENLRR